MALCEGGEGATTDTHAGARRIVGRCALRWLGERAHPWEQQHLDVKT